MKVSLVTGDPYDYIAMVAESVPDCVSLSRIAASQFPREKERIELLHTANDMELRVRVSAIQTKHDPAINIAHDQEN